MTWWAKITFRIKKIRRSHIAPKEEGIAMTATGGVSKERSGYYYFLPNSFGVFISSWRVHFHAPFRFESLNQTGPVRRDMSLVK